MTPIADEMNTPSTGVCFSVAAVLRVLLLWAVRITSLHCKHTNWKFEIHWPVAEPCFTVHLHTFSVEWQPYLNCSLMFADGSDHQLPGSIYFYILPVNDCFWTKARCNGAVQVFHLAWPLLCCFSPLAGPSAPGSCRFSAEAPSCPTHHTTSCSWYDSCAGGAESDITFLVKRERAVKWTEKSWKCCCLSTVWKRMVVWHTTDRWTECSHRLRSLLYGLWAFMVDYSLHCLYFPLNGHYVVLEKKLELRILIFTILMRSIRNIL